MAKQKLGFTRRRIGTVMPPKVEEPNLFAWLNQIQEELAAPTQLRLSGTVIDRRVDVPAGTDIELFHGLKKIPWRIVDLAAENGRAYARDQERDKWTNQMIVIRHTVSEPHVSILVLLEPAGTSHITEED